jgi:tRNA nucleotidyltransferase/poly(A) polymerase
MMDKGNNINMAKNIMSSSDGKHKENGSNYDQESETIMRINLNERLAEEMKKMKLTAKQWKSILFRLNKIHILVIILP